MKIKCLIVDDEPIARQIVEKYCSYITDLEVVHSCSDALQAREVLSSTHIDIVFLDINMPVLDGLAFVKTLRRQPQIIFTTAYKEYAPEAFDVSACDYLLKPFSLERFIQSVDKAKAAINQNIQADTSSHNPIHPIYVKSDGKIFKISIGDLLYAEAQGNNVRIVTIPSVITITMTFSEFEKLLPPLEFIRVHRSFIINKSKIRMIEGNRILIDNNEIPIGANYREQFLRALSIK